MRACLLLAFLAALTPALRAQPSQHIEEAKLLAWDGTDSDNFGFAVDIEGDRALVGAFRAVSDTGAVYVFERVEGEWIPWQRLDSPTQGLSGWFGKAVAISGDRLLVGANGENGGRGAAHVFARVGTTWTYEATFTAPDGAINDNFGAYVALSDDRALVGAIGHDHGADDGGAAYAFRRSGTT